MNGEALTAALGRLADRSRKYSQAVEDSRRRTEVHATGDGVAFVGIRLDAVRKIEREFAEQAERLERLAADVRGGA